MSTAKPYRIAIVGASSLAGKELSDIFSESPLGAAQIMLLDEEALAGQLTATANEPALIQKLEADSFVAVDFTFFTGDPDLTRKYWKAARAAGASIIDMTYALEAETGVLIRAPWVDTFESQPTHPDLTTPAVVPAHPAALMLLQIASSLHARLPLRALAATIFEPASEHGQLAMDELHQQTVALLSFRTLPREQYDAQIAFNAQTTLGENARINLPVVQTRILTHYTAASGDTAPAPALQLVQAATFHGYAASILIDLESEATIAQVETALRKESVTLIDSESDPLGNVSAAGQSNILVTVTAASTPATRVNDEDEPSTRFWLWLAADNLRMAALNAIACAVELRRLRPQGKVQ